MPDVPPKTPMVPARLQWESGEEYVYKDDQGLPVMVPQFDPLLEDFVERHNHGASEDAVVGGQVISSWQIDQKSWDTMDVVTKVKSELQSQTNKHYEDEDTYKQGALQCYNEHGNPDIQSGCPDYLSDAKRIGPATYNADGHTITIPQQFRHYLCHLCPFQQTAIAVELRRRKGLYNEQKVLEHRKQRRKKARQ
jgi:hypothetical protein